MAGFKILWERTQPKAIGRNTIVVGGRPVGHVRGDERAVKTSLEGDPRNGDAAFATEEDAQAWIDKVRKVQGTKAAKAALEIVAV